MNKGELTKAVMQRLRKRQLSKALVAEAVDAVFGEVRDTLTRGESGDDRRVRVLLAGGTESPQRAQSENRGRNQGTGERRGALQARGRPEADGRNRATDRV